MAAMDVVDIDLGWPVAQEHRERARCAIIRAAIRIARGDGETRRPARATSRLECGGCPTLDGTQVRSKKGAQKKLPAFAHPSEREFARILDFYQIEWQYEPRTFELQWDDHGHPIESFAPDFYLPELDLFIELTTLRQSLVTKKNRKLRRLRELYPDVNIKLLYRRDFKSLMEKYGLPLPAGPAAIGGEGEASPAAAEPPADASQEEGLNKLSPE